MLRRDITLSNVRRERLVASHWAVDDAAKRPCVIFCHANSASRVQAVHYLALLLSLGCSVLALDFAGAGLSEGDVVTLGFREADDIAAAVQFLRGDARVSRIAGWGSSAGAAALLFCMAKYDAALACCVLDGSYADVRQVAACVEINQCVGCEDDAMIQHEHAVKFDFRTGCGGAGRAEHGRRVFGAVARRAGRHRAPRRERARARRRHARRAPARGARPFVPRARALPPRHGRRPARRPAVWKSISASDAPENSSLSHFPAMTRPCWLRRTVRNPLCHAIERAVKFDFHTGVLASPCLLEMLEVRGPRVFEPCPAPELIERTVTSLSPAKTCPGPPHARL